MPDAQVSRVKRRILRSRRDKSRQHGDRPHDCSPGQSLGIKVTVEGVETQTQLTLLQAMGCDTKQGYLFSKPVEGGQVRAFLAGGRALSA